MKFTSLILNIWGSFAHCDKFSLSTGAAMAAFGYQCAIEWKSEKTCIFGRILAGS